MSTFTREGNPEVEIISAIMAQSPYDKSGNDLAVCLEVRDVTDHDQKGHWYGVFNDEVGNKPDPEKTRWELTLMDLEKLGWEHGAEFTPETFKTLIGVKTVAWVKQREYEVNGVARESFDVKMLGANNYGPKAVDPADAMAKVRALVGNKAVPKKAAPKQEPVASAELETDDDPFG